VAGGASQKSVQRNTQQDANPYLAAVEEALKVMEHLGELVQADRLLFRDVGLLFDLVEHAKEDLVDQAAEGSVQRRRSHDGLFEVSSVSFIGRRE
jgi:hypothetical protein